MQTFNITSATTTTLRDLHDDISGNVKSIRLTNTHSTTAVTVDLFLEDSSSNKFYIVKTSIPGNTSLLLTEGLSYSRNTFTLKITTTAGGLSTSVPLSVIIQ
jgi:hypothetical protein